MAAYYTSLVLAQFDTNLALVTTETPDAGFKSSGYRFDLDKEPDSAIDGTYYLDIAQVDPHARNWGTGETISEVIVTVRVAYFRGGGDKNEGDRQGVLRNAADDAMRIADICENPSNYNAATTGIREIRYQGSRRTGELPRFEIWESRFWVQWRSDVITT